MEEKPLSESESLRLITDMIQKAKRNYQKGGSFHILLWGWVIMLANFSHYIIQSFTSFEHPYMVWLVTIPAGIISGVYGARQSRNARVSSHLDNIYGQIWLAVGFAIVVVLLFMGNLNFNHNAVILLFSGIGTYISGRLLRFTPMYWGGLALGIAAVIAFNVAEVNQYLVAGFGILVGYLIPGYLLKKNEK